VCVCVCVCTFTADSSHAQSADSGSGTFLFWINVFEGRIHADSEWFRVVNTHTHTHTIFLPKAACDRTVWTLHNYKQLVHISA